MNNGQKIFIVEDEIITAMEIKDRLQSLGFEVLGEAASGEDALARIENDKPDLVLMDIKLKGRMDGIETGLEIRDRFNIPIIYLSAYSDETTMSRAQATQPFSYLLKPFSDKELKSSIELAIERKRSEVVLKRYEYWLMSLQNHIRDAVIALEPDGTVKTLNRRAEELTGLNLEDVIGENLDNIHIIENTQDAESPITCLLDDNSIEIHMGKAILRSESRQEISTDFTFVPVCDEEGTMLGSYLILHQNGG